MSKRLARTEDYMMEYLRFGEGLHAASFDEQFRDTFLGQVHLAGTGPQDKTCRECIHWRLLVKGAPTPPGYYAKTNKDKAGQIKKAKCLYPMPHKANRRFPHDAKSCRFFEQSDAPPPAQVAFAGEGK